MTVDADNLDATEVDIVAESLEEVVEANSTSPNVSINSNKDKPHGGLTNLSSLHLVLII